MIKILIGTLLMSISMTAQERKKNDFEIAPCFGVASANYFGDVKHTSTNFVFSPNFGVDAYFYINHRWSFKMGVEQATMGADVYHENNSVEEKLRFIVIPFHVNRSFSASNNWMLNFGPTFSFLKKVTLNGLMSV